MGQGMTSDIEAFDADRLLKMALTLLDGSKNFLAAAYVSRALELLAHDREGTSASIEHMQADHVAFSPTWGNLVDRHACAG